MDYLSAPLATPLYTDRRVQVAALAMAVAAGYHYYKRRQAAASSTAAPQVQEQQAPPAQQQPMPMMHQQMPQQPMLGHAGHGLPPMHDGPDAAMQGMEQFYGQAQ
jgi:hypothetical protein